MSRTWTGTTGNDRFEASKTLGLFWQSWILDGGLGNDTLIGGPENDVLKGGQGIDRLEGRGGNDTYYVEDSRVVIIEGQNEGIDLVYTKVDYTLPANVENLSLDFRTITANGRTEYTHTALRGEGNAMDNRIIGNTQNNRLVGHAGNDTIYGEVGHDHLIGGSGADLLYGGPGDDALWSHNENLSASGDEGSSDTLYGGWGDDYLVAGNGIDYLYGEGGNDTLVSGLDNQVDVLDGGEGFDTYILRAPTTVIERHNQGTDVVELHYDAQIYYVPNNIEVVRVVGDIKHVLGHSGNDYLQGNHLNNSLSGADGDDFIGGMSGHDYLNGGNGNDTLLGGDGNDTLFGSAGFDSLKGEAGDDKLDGWGGSFNEIDRLNGGAGADTFIIGDSSPRGVFYLGNGLSYGIIEDFNRAEGDKIQIGRNHMSGITLSTGTSMLDSFKRDTFIHYNNGGIQDLVAIVHNNTTITTADFVLV
jgi:Ca2+-binding RTX toxin-like protein